MESGCPLIIVPNDEKAWYLLALARYEGSVHNNNTASFQKNLPEQETGPAAPPFEDILVCICRFNADLLYMQ